MTAPRSPAGIVVEGFYNAIREAFGGGLMFTAVDGAISNALDALDDNDEKQRSVAAALINGAATLKAAYTPAGGSDAN